MDPVWTTVYLALEEREEEVQDEQVEQARKSQENRRFVGLAAGLTILVTSLILVLEILRH